MERMADGSFQRMTAPYRAEEMSTLALSPLVNSARVDDPGCCRAAASGFGAWILRNVGVPPAWAAGSDRRRGLGIEKTANSEIFPKIFVPEICILNLYPPAPKMGRFGVSRRLKIGF